MYALHILKTSITCLQYLNINQNVQCAHPSGRLEKTTRSSPHHVAQYRPTGSETTPPYAPRSSRFGSEPPSVKDDVDIWRYAIVRVACQKRRQPFVAITKAIRFRSESSIARSIKSVRHKHIWHHEWCHEEYLTQTILQRILILFRLNPISGIYVLQEWNRCWATTCVHFVYRLHGGPIFLHHYVHVCVYYICMFLCFYVFAVSKLHWH